MPESRCPTCGTTPPGIPTTEPQPPPRPAEQRPLWARLLGAPFHIFWVSDEKALAYASTNLPQLNLAFIALWLLAFSMFLTIRMDNGGQGHQEPTEVREFKALLNREPISASSKELISGFVTSMEVVDFHQKAALRELLGAVLALTAVGTSLEFRTFIVAKRLARIQAPIHTGPSPTG